MEYEEKYPICRLCLTSCGRTFENVELVTTEMLGILGLKLSSNVNGKPVMCKACSEDLEKWFDFKTMCLYTEDCINSFRDKGSNVKLDIGEIYLKKNEIENIPAPKCRTVCRLCMEIAEPGCYISLDDEAKDTTVAKGILAMCFSELDLNTTENPVVCVSCNSSLCSYFDFITERFAVEEEIKKDCEVEAENDEDQGRSSNRAPQSCAETILKCENSVSDTDICKIFTDIKFDVCDDNVIYDELKSLDLHIKCEVNESEGLNDNQMKKSSDALQFATRDWLFREHSYANMNAVGEFHEKKEDGEVGLKREDLAKKEADEFNILHEEVELKTEEGSGAGCQGSSPIPKDDGLHTHKGRGKDVFQQHHKNVSERTYSCEMCTYTAKQQRSLRRHMIMHKSPSDVTTYWCKMCAYNTHRKDHFKRHMLIHQEVTTYSCEICTYKARQKGYLKRHMLTHKSFSEVTTYSCEICTYKTKGKYHLKRHMLNHKSFSEVTTYSCEICTYKTKGKYNLKRHMLNHKSFSEVTTYSCEICTYKTKRKSHLKQHMLIHKSFSEVTTYSCEICTFASKHKSSLKQHMLIHKSFSEVTTYSCEICTYKAKGKYNLKRHMLIHKSFSEVTIYSCEICTYKAKQKFRLKEHMLTHKSFSEVTTYSCEICTYASKYKSNLKSHMLKHKKFSDVPTYSCEICRFTTKRKSSLKEHTSIHKSSSEVTTYSCEICLYKTQRKYNLKHHMLIHKNFSEITTYSCEICRFTTKRKSSLKEHMSIHKSSSQWRLAG